VRGVRWGKVRVGYRWERERDRCVVTGGVLLIWL
jgi:hypothetical protein